MLPDLIHAQMHLQDTFYYHVCNPLLYIVMQRNAFNANEILTTVLVHPPHINCRILPYDEFVVS